MISRCNRNPVDGTFDGDSSLCPSVDTTRRTKASHADAVIAPVGSRVKAARPVIGSAVDFRMRPGHDSFILMSTPRPSLITISLLSVGPFSLSSPRRSLDSPTYFLLGAIFQGLQYPPHLYRTAIILSRRPKQWLSYQCATLLLVASPLLNRLSLST